MSLLFFNSCRPRINLNGAIFTPIHKQNPCQMLITGKKRPFCFVLKQEKALNRGKKGAFHIKTPCKRGGGGTPLPSALPLLRHSRAFPFTSSWSVATGSIHFIRSFDRGKSSVTPSAGARRPATPRLLIKIMLGESPILFEDHLFATFFHSVNVGIRHPFGHIPCIFRESLQSRLGLNAE